MRQSSHYLKVPVQAGGGMSSFSWANVAGCGTVSLATVPSSLSRVDVDLARKNVANAAQHFLDASARSGYRVPLLALGGRYPWGSNSFVLNNGIVLALAYDFTKQRAFLDGALDALDYILGRNPMAKSYVTSFGTRPLQNPHHRFWAYQANPQFPCPPPGVMSGGPNSGVEDPAAKAAGLGGCAPQKCYFDDIESWSTNEVAINWNAPLAWLAAFADEKAQESVGQK
jgi:endoglucanase